MGWVKEIDNNRRSLQEKVPDVWLHLRESLQFAVNEFNEIEARSIQPTSLHSANGGDLIQIRKRGSPDKGVEIFFDREAGRITSARAGSRCCLGFQVDHEGNVGLMMDGKSVTIEQASRLILEPLLFDAGISTSNS